jgi:hypothetical protein
LSKKKSSVSQQKLRQETKTKQVSFDWCSPCIRCFGWLKGLPRDLFVDILCFLVGIWKRFSGHLQNAPSLKYIVSSNNTDLASVSNSAEHTRICLLLEKSHLQLLAKWSVIIGNDVKYYSIRECTLKDDIDLDRRE